MPTIATVSSHTRPDPDAVPQVAGMLSSSARPVMVTERVGEDPTNVAPACWGWPRRSLSRLLTRAVPR